MRKIVILSLAIIIVAGCSGIKRTGKTGKGKEFAGTVSMADVIDQNLSRESFYIQKAEVDFDSGNAGFSFVATIKHVVPDKYLISLRMRTGIEVGRIYIDKDTILANDRINRILYYGKSSVLAAKYGVPLNIIPVLFGDFVGEPGIDAQKAVCQDGKKFVDSYIKGIRLAYELDCSSKKPLSVMQEGYSGVSGDINYDKFEKNGGKFSPTEVTLNHRESGSILKFKFERIETPWDGNIEFIPGNRYDRVELR